MTGLTCRRGARIAGLTGVQDAGPGRAGCALEAYIPVPSVHPFVNPLLYAVPVQLLAYHTALLKGTDVDKPRNLAKSVTVE